MAKTINTHSYALQGTAEGSALYGAVLATVPTEARMQSLPTRQNGEAGVRSSRTITQVIVGADGLPHKATMGISSFLPDSLPSTALDVSFAEMAAWVDEVGFLTAIKNKSVE